MSSSPLRAQVVVTKKANGHRLQSNCQQIYLPGCLLSLYCADCSAVSRLNWFSKLDLRSDYHHVPLSSDKRKYTVFEAGSQLHQFKRIPFGLQNAVTCFQHVVNHIILDFKCEGTFAYLNDITVCGKTRKEHDKNLQRFLNAFVECNLTLNENKCIYATDDLILFGYHIFGGVVRPDA